METENTSKTNISSLGEFGLIQHLTQFNTSVNSSTVKSVGDDCAVLQYDAQAQVLVSTDMLVEGIHFDPIYTPLKHLGYKAITTCISDIAAMNATPTSVTVAISTSSKYTLEALEELYNGMYLACKKYSIDLVGGDTTSSLMGLSICVTAIGHATQNEIVYRNTAQTNDLIVVTGDLGAAYLGLQLLEREKNIYLENSAIQPDLDGNDYILERQLKPEARTDIKELLQKLEVIPTSMIDISDGLSSEILHICKQSGLGCEIFEDKLPIDPTVSSTAREWNLDPTVCAMNGGEDYELLFTVNINDFEKIKHNPNLTVIGHITATKGSYLLNTRSGSLVEIQAQGWNPLQNK
jgi:thiamine-monophosphate kinase